MNYTINEKFDCMKRREYLIAKERLGLIKKNTYGTNMRIIEVLPNDKIIVQFQDDHQFEKEIYWNNFKRGTVLNPYDRTAYNIGYAGIGEYETSSKGIEYRTYKIWKELLGRCYPISEHGRQLHKAYEDCTVCEEWKCYQTFARWYEENYYEVGNERMHLDKDILVKGNKHYSPKTCLIIPQRINMIFMNKAKSVDNDLPNSIYRCKTGFKASYNGKSLGVYKTLEDSINTHDKFKRLHIKQVAIEYKDLLPYKVYDALITW